MAVEKHQTTEPRWGAWVWVKWKAGAPEDAWNEWRDHSEIKQAWSTPGNWDCSLWINLDNPDDIEKFVWREIRKNKWVEKTDTHWAKRWW
ncbi:MAG: Lrp/AsnC ligand binding domain-containing protein [Chlamydiia bacterium]|nr:Lrp/AsnC ligand binding domain-containing protein [Chlamydiia bacterium]